MNKKHEFKLEWAGKELKISTGVLAHQTNGSCLVQYGDTVILATAVINKEKNEGMDFFPLMVEFEEKMYAAGRIKGSRFIKRETRPTDEAILTARLIDRGLRPLFDERIRQNVQIVVTVLQHDGENDPDIPSIIGASCALELSDIPWDGPIAGIRIGKIEKEWVLNPSYEARDKCEFELTACYFGDKVINIEASANETDEKTMYEAFKFGSKHIKSVLQLQEQIRKELGKEKFKIDFTEEIDSDEVLDKNQKASLKQFEDLKAEAIAYADKHIDKYLFDVPVGTKTERKEKVSAVKEEMIEMLKKKNVGKEKIKKILEFFDTFIEERVSEAIIKKSKRIDGRKLDQIRTLNSEVGLMNRLHGSALFERGETQVLSIVTLGAPGDEQMLDGMELTGKKRFMHHYNFPPYSVGEARPMRGAGRREVGHGALAEKAIMPVLPKKEDFPYTIRVVSEVMGSNGSSSMASTCGCSLSLMDAGVPITTPVAGVAIGLASNEKGEYKVITDIQDLEDGQGGMDFKVTGTKNGITAIQMDTKTRGLSLEIIEEALEKGRKGRMEILEVMSKAIDKPRAEMSKYAPRIITIKINPDKIRDVIGPGGKMINEIIDKTGVSIDIEDDGTVFITSVSENGSKEAVEWIERLTEEAKIGKVYEGTVVRLMDFGAFVEIFPGTDGMVHVSEISKTERVNDIKKYLKVGQKVKVKVMKIDDQGRINLSIKQAE
ncbi:polyribonucleotide nucleotidyltransferase [Candidatus Falkowbacteria bacterium RIFOXYD2_FULL_35_9]|uniref:Polyribonucleotide nucleotidyltransferase n=1 Tax=Candidatus Falkowbacteria bacterium RIFOXYC2_FULL_36_12 TaxID=1798002 RepID=A0A1F5T3W3_9BACT|nr:MAG: polyribonucleotide nucleotidyltransferase [Candidatus Falkowbacteria bacterium RIFOXYC2_FULL_36_12]OGF33898.1 MAG: polyribonucleotide nucleotidyltransferase [Candidatus Falkowbacteria bacterium RIFOXYA2_FULL_35_8]OGF45781.1 MAG: polyribonucleotide nucleotidyltransferase [Candidatus Falkowbacteria bacterium RIFOXYD2_FULL_35_9]